MSIVGEVVAGAALSAFFDGLFKQLSSSDLLKIFRQENVDADLKKWKKSLEKISEVLDDAEDKQMTKGSVKTWLGELEDLAYDVDDILDELATEALRRRLNAEEPSTSKIRKFIPACCVGFDPSSIVFDVNMSSKIKVINTRLQKILTDKRDLELIKNTEGRRTRTTRPRPPTTSLVNEGHNYGRDKDKEAIVKLLLESGDAQLSVIPIVGMGGWGKTTLAQLVYKDNEVSRHFELKAWVCVSEDFDNLRLTKEILHSFTSESCHDDNDLDSLQRKLKDTLSGKKFLLILDDVWNENYELWTELCKPFEFGALGSKIVVTTRNDGVSSIMRTTPPYKLKELSRDACLRVFTHHALDATDFSKYPGLEEFGQKIVDRCKGVPLAAKVLGGLLRNKHDPCEWKNVLNSKIWNISEEKGSIFFALKLSYNYLPSYLKRCFTYCSLFPKDYDFKEEELVLLWMAEGLVQETEEKPMEDLGREYFRDLLSRSFFQQSSTHKSLFVMHDLMHDLAQWAAGDFCCRLEDQLGGSKISTKVRHFSYVNHSSNCNKKFDDFFKDMHLRTFILLSSRFISNLTNFDVKYCSLPQLRCLRGLSLSGKDIFELPSSIGDLKHLRYLNLSYTKITTLPKSTSSLYNLQTLILKGCYYLTKLPEKIENLVKLRHLNISNASSIREMPAEIAKLKSLQTLCFEGMHGWQNWIPCRVECEEFPSLRELSISDCPKLEGKFPHHLPSLEKLSIGTCEQLVVSFLEKIENLVNLRQLNISNTNSIRDMPGGIAKLKSLQTLCFEGMHGWQNWIPCRVECEKFPSLRELSISNCPKLKGKFPHHLPSLKKLSIYKCEHLVISIPSLPMLQELEIVRCKDVVDGFVKAEKLEITHCQEVTSLSLLALEIRIESCQSLVNIKVKSTSRTLTINKCSALEFVMDEGGASSTSTLLMNEENPSCIGNNNASLPEHLKISNCPSLKCVSTIALETIITSCQSLVNIKLKSTLRTLTINECSALESLEFVMNEGGASSTSSLLMNEENPSCIGNNNASLPEHLKISNCPSLKCVSTIALETIITSCQSLVNIKLKSTLRTLTINECSALESLEFVMNEGGASSTSSLLMNEENLSCIGNNNASLLEHLEISDCPSLKCVSTIVDLAAMLKFLDIRRCPNLTSLGDTLPTTLKLLKLWGCPKLESIVDKLNKDTLLEELVIFNCENLRCLPRGLHELCHLKEIRILFCDSLISLGDLLPTNLRRLEIESCKKLEALPNNIHNLNFLQDLTIDECPSIVSFPEEGFPTNLRKLRLLGANLCKQVFELGLHRLTLLTSLSISDGIMDSFPEEEDEKTTLMLPTSLTTLILSGFPNLLFLSGKFFQNLSALEEFSIYWCPKLASLPEECFPPSLQKLYIYACPVLKQNYKKDGGIMWSKIANIPSVKIDDVEQQK